MKRLIKYYVDGGRMGELVCLEVVDAGEWAKIERVIEVGVEVYFGEVLGKHSAVSLPIEEEDVTVLSENPDEVTLFEKLVGVYFGNVCLSESAATALENDDGDEEED